MRFKRRLQQSAEFDMTPMIDCIFLLLIFFMVSSTYIIRSSIEIKLPKSDTADVKPEKDIVVSITDEGQFYLNEIHVTGDDIKYRRAIGDGPDKAYERSLAELSELLTFKMNELNMRFILIRSGRDARTQELIDVMSICREIGADGVQIGVEKLEGR